MPLIGLLILIAVAFISGTLTMPTQDDLFLILSSFALLVMAWFYNKDRRKGEKNANLEPAPKEERKKVKEKK